MKLFIELFVDSCLNDNPRAAQFCAMLTSGTMQKIDDLLNEGHQRYSKLHKLLRTAATQKHLTAGVRALLPDTLGRGISAVTLEGPNLRLLCDDGAIATRLRFTLPSLLIAVQSLGDFAEVRQISVRVVPPR